jgi:hypothetical protein
MIQDPHLRIGSDADGATNVSLALDLSVFLKILAAISLVLGLLALLLPGFINHCHPVQCLALALCAIFLFTIVEVSRHLWSAFQTDAPLPSAPPDLVFLFKRPPPVTR